MTTEAVKRACEELMDEFDGEFSFDDEGDQGTYIEPDQ
jgi:hypothetical protein